MSFLQQKWNEHQSKPLRRYSSQREFEADWVGGLRRRYRLSQERLASLANVSVTTVQNWENPTSAKRIAEHNQDRLRDIERELWIKAHVTLLEPCPPYIRALHELMSANRDGSAQGLADYLVGCMDANDAGRARLLHWAGLAYSIADPASLKARAYEEAALQALGDGHGDGKPGNNDHLAAAIENEILGAQFEDLLALPEGDARHAKGRQLMQASQRLFQRDQQPAYLWNALEVACRASLDTQDRFALVHELQALLGEESVRRRIRTEEAYQAARSLLAESATLN
jgi:transcriptional regulator with XRE-family HTH domain